ncbi:hypothetical protein [Streptomyces sp. NPDC051546]|uniref:imine reductase family protein n=1 Tax=Streptomyces sp. NPDC051546 TaxID=3365655 RepID=UPI0037A83619
MALLSAMTGLFAGISHAYALIEGEDVSPKDLAPLLAEWPGAMGFFAGAAAERLVSGDFTSGVESNLAMQVTGSATLLRTAAEQGVSTELIGSVPGPDAGAPGRRSGGPRRRGQRRGDHPAQALSRLPRT